MTWYEHIPLVSYILVDREGTKASLDLRYAVDSDQDSLWSAVQSEDRFLALTDCGFYARMLSVGAAWVGADQPIGSNLTCGSLVLHSEADTFTSIVIPGIRSDLMVTDGCFAGQRINMLHDDIIAISIAMMVQQLVTERGDPVLAISSGGILNMWSTLAVRSG